MSRTKPRSRKGGDDESVVNAMVLIARGKPGEPCDVFHAPLKPGVSHSALLELLDLREPWRPLELRRFSNLVLLVGSPRKNKSRSSRGA